MNRIVGALAALVLSAICMATAEAALVISREAELVVRGELKTGDLKGIPETGITTLVFENSPGGSVAAALEYVEAIQRRKLKTKVRGKCLSACAVSFLAGESRTVDQATTSILLFHLTSKMVDGARVRGTYDDAVIKLIGSLTGGRFSGEALELTRKSWSENQGLVFYFRRGFFGKINLTLYCDGTQGSDLSKCTIMHKMSAEDLGIVN